MHVDQERAALAYRMRRIVLSGRYRGPIARMLEQENGRPRGFVPQGALYAGAADKDVDLPDGRGVRIIFSHDIGHHRSGWFKNPDYEQCLHLSLSYRYPALNHQLPQDHADAAEWVKAFYGDDRRYVWVESPKFAEGRAADVWHYRVFIDKDWNPIIPRGEVYSRELTEAGWNSYSDARDAEEKEQAGVND